MLIPATALTALLLVPAPLVPALLVPAPCAPAAAAAVTLPTPAQEDRPTLGVTLDVGGGPLRILSVEPEGAARAGGLQVGDLIVGVAGRAVAGGQEAFDALRAAIDAAGIGGPLALEVERGGERLELRVVVGDQDGAVPESTPAAGEDAGADGEPADATPDATPAPAPPAPPAPPAAVDERGFLGVQIVDGAPGARFEAVLEGTAAARAGLLAGDVVLAFEGEPVADGDALVARLRERRAGERVGLTVQRDGDRLEFEVELGARPAGAVPAPQAPTPATPSTPPTPPTPPAPAGVVERELPSGLEFELRFESLDGEAFDLENFESVLEALVTEFEQDFDGERFEAEIERLIADLGAEIEGAEIEFEWDRDDDARSERAEGDGRRRREVRQVEARMRRVEGDLERLFEGFEERFAGVFEALESDLEQRFDRLEGDLGRTVDRFEVELGGLAAEFASALMTELAPLIEEAAAGVPRRPAPAAGLELPELIQLRAELDVVRAERDAANARVTLLEDELAALRVEVRELIRAVEALQR